MHFLFRSCLLLMHYSPCYRFFAALSLIIRFIRLVIDVSLSDCRNELRVVFGHGRCLIFLLTNYLSPSNKEAASIYFYYAEFLG